MDKKTRGQRQGFSLAELLVVLAVVSLLLALTPTLFQGLLTSTGVSGGVDIASAAVASARSEAGLSGEDVRLAIDVDPISPHYLHRLVVIKLIQPEDESESEKWVPVSNMILLPKGIFFHPDYIGGTQSMTFQYSSAEPEINWSYFSFNFAGQLKTPVGATRSQLVVTKAESSNQQGQRTITIAEADEKGMQGFVLRRSGAITHFPTRPTLPSQPEP